MVDTFTNPNQMLTPSIQRSWTHSDSRAHRPAIETTSRVFPFHLSNGTILSHRLPIPKLGLFPYFIFELLRAFTIMLGKRARYDNIVRYPAAYHRLRWLLRSEIKQLRYPACAHDSHQNLSGEAWVLSEGSILRIVTAMREASSPITLLSTTK